MLEIFYSRLQNRLPLRTHQEIFSLTSTTGLSEASSDHQAPSTLHRRQNELEPSGR